MADKRNATSSWSGYLHQGQAGLLVALREINRIFELGASLDGWFIIFENAEDFDIKNTMGVFSRHQVKAKKAANFPNSVGDVLGTQVYADGVLASKGFQFKKLEGGVLTEIEVDEDSRFLHVITEIQGFNLNETDFDELYSKPNWVANPHNIKLYEYEDEKFYCPLVTGENSTLESYCLREIEIYLESINHPEASIKDFQLRIYFSIVNALDLQIKHCHVDNVDMYPTMSFLTMVSLLNCLELTNYFITLMKRKFALIASEYIADSYEYGDDLDKDALNRINQSMLEIYHLSNDQFEMFIKYINPNEINIGNVDSALIIPNLIKKDNIESIFLNCIHKIEGALYMLEDRGYKEDGGYIVSLISGNNVKIIKNKIAANSELTRDFFKKSYLINYEITDPDNITDLVDHKSSNWSGNVGESDKFFKGGMKLISVSEAIDKLNEVGSHNE